MLANLAIGACGVVALVYGGITTRQVLAADAGTARMQEISAAVQEGARAYLNRQYLTIGMVGVVILVILGPPARPGAGHRLCHRRHPIGRRRLYRHERLRAGQCAHRAGQPQRPGAPA